MKRFFLIFATVLVMGFSQLNAQDVDSQRAEKQKIEDEIQVIDKQLKGLSIKQKASTKHLTLIRRKASDRKVLIKAMDDEIEMLGKEIEERNAHLAQIEARLDTLYAYYRKLIYNTYKNRSTKVWFMYVLGSEDIGQGYRRLRYIKDLAVAVNQQGGKIKELKGQVEKEKAELERKKAKTTKLKSTREQEYTKLLDEEKESKAIIDNISKDKKKYQAELASKRKQVEALNKEIERLLKAAVKKEQSAKPSAAETALSGEFEQNKGKLGWPVKSGVITEKFGVHFHPVYKNIKLPENNGITISTTKGAEAYCVFGGTVKQIVMMPGYNHCVLVQHGSYYTFYCKLESVAVKTGQKVEAGTVLGVLEADGQNSSTIHFQIWKGTAKQNPENWLRN